MAWHVMRWSCAASLGCWRSAFCRSRPRGRSAWSADVVTRHGAVIDCDSAALTFKHLDNKPHQLVRLSSGHLGPPLCPQRAGRPATGTGQDAEE